jgi:selenocysteine lyase/cysteine desulfurase
MFKRKKQERQRMLDPAQWAQLDPAQKPESVTETDEEVLAGIEDATLDKEFGWTSEFMHELVENERACVARFVKAHPEYSITDVYRALALMHIYAVTSSVFFRLVDLDEVITMVVEGVVKLAAAPPEDLKDGTPDGP